MRLPQLPHTIAHSVLDQSGADAIGRTIAERPSRFRLDRRAPRQFNKCHDVGAERGTGGKLARPTARRRRYQSRPNWNPFWGRDGRDGLAARGRAYCDQSNRSRKPKAGKPRKRVGHRRRGQLEHRRLRDGYQRQSRHNGQFQDRYGFDELQDRHLPPRLLRRHGRPKGRYDPAHWPAESAGAPARRDDRRRSMPATGPFRPPGTVPPDAVSGVYIAKLTRQDGISGENQIPFIVRDDSSHSDVVFQTVGRDLAGLQRMGRSKFLRRQRTRDGSRLRAAPTR